MLFQSVLPHVKLKSLELELVEKNEIGNFHIEK